MSRVLVYCAVSLDGFVAGPGDDLSWLEGQESSAHRDPETIDFEGFLATIGAMLMGRRTHDVVAGFDVPWPYGPTPVLVATTRPLPEAGDTVTACSGTIEDLCQRARQLAGDRDVYLDGGDLITQALQAGCVDELILSVVPVLLGRGVPLYRGEQLWRFAATQLGRLGTTHQIRLIPLKAATT